MDLKSIVEGCSNADSESIEALYTAYSDRLMKLCISYVKSEEEAYDLFHDAFLLIISKIDQLKDSRKLEAWMNSIVRNLALQHLRHKKKFVHGVEEMDLEDVSIMPAYPPIPFEVMMKMINELPNQYGKAFRMSVLDGLSHKEIGSILEIEEKTSSSNLYRARIILREALKKYWAGLLIVLLAIIIPILHKEEEKTAPLNHGRLAKVTGDTAIIVTMPDTIEICPIHLQERTPEAIVMEEADSSCTHADTVVIGNERIVREKTSAEKPEKYYAWENVDWDEDDIPKARRRISIRMQFSNLPGSTTRLTAMNSENGLIADMLPEVEDFTHTSTRVDSWSDLERLLAVLKENYPDSTMYSSLHAIAKGMRESGNNDLKESREYAQPITFGLKASIGLNRKWALITGVEYSRLSSRGKSGIDTLSVTNKQTIHYLGIPLGISYDIWSKERMNISASAYGRMDFPMAASSIIEHHNGNLITYSSKTSMNVPLQWSVGSGICFQYTLGKNIWIYAEPQLQYHFGSDGDVKTTWTERPLDFAIPIGIRYSW